jgi:O-acetyl-ADP-ribose deacetylase (regulator of RNase III)
VTKFILLILIACNIAFGQEVEVPASAARSVDQHIYNLGIHNLVQGQMNTLIGDLSGTVKDFGYDISVNYQTDKFTSLRVTSRSDERLIIQISLTYDTVGRLNNVPVQISIDGYNTNLKSIWQRADLAMNSVAKQGIQGSLFGTTPALPFTRFSANEVDAFSETVSGILTPYLDEVRNTIGVAFSKGLKIPTGRAEPQLGFNFEETGGGKLTAKESTDQPAPPERKYRYISYQTERLANTLYGIVTVSSFARGVYLLFTNPSLYDYSARMSEHASPAPYFILGSGMLGAWFLNTLPALMSMISPKPKWHKYVTLVEMFADKWRNRRLYAAEVAAAKAEQERETQEKLRIATLKSQKRTEKIGNIKIILFGGNRTDMTATPADVMVVPQFSNGISDDGVAGAIIDSGAQSGWEKYIEVIKNFGGKVPFGTAHLFPSGGGNSSHLAHVVTVASDRSLPEAQRNYRGVFRGYEVIKEATKEAVLATSEAGLGSMNFPALGTGVLGELKTAPELSAMAILEGVQEASLAAPPGSHMISEVRIIAYTTRDLVAFHEAFDTYFTAPLSALTPTETTVTANTRFCAPWLTR